MYFTTVHQSIVMFLKENERFTGREMRRIGVSYGLRLEWRRLDLCRLSVV